MQESRWDIETRKLGPAIKTEDCGRRLDEYLAEFFPFFSRSGWQKEISSGVVFVNGHTARKSSQKLHLGDELSRLHPLQEEPDVDTDLRVLWSDGMIAAVAKPAGLPMHESGRYRRKTVAGVLPQILGPDWAHVHRLDRETSGVLICAKTPQLRARLVGDWTRLSVRKTYLAVTAGIPDQTDWQVDSPILAVRHERTNRAVLSSMGDAAVTKFSLLKAAKTCALIEVRPLTGRTNQIRLHLEASGLTLVGEKVYGVDPRILETYRVEGNTLRVQEMAGFPRHALHAWKIEFLHPLTGEKLCLTAPMSEDLKHLCRQRDLWSGCDKDFSPGLLQIFEH